jgi:hypothetical protein
VFHTPALIRKQEKWKANECPNQENGQRKTE